MDQSDVLLTLAEVSVAFAGFAGVVAVFGRRDPSTWSYANRNRFRLLIEMSLCAVFFCILPFCLSALHLPAQMVWRLASAFVATYLLVAVLVYMIGLRAVASSDRAEISRSVTALFFALDILAIAVNLYNVATLGEVGPFLLALLILVTKTGFLFARMMLLSFRGDHAA
jgi:hypothetical protein